MVQTANINLCCSCLAAECLRWTPRSCFVLKFWGHSDDIIKFIFFKLDKTFLESQKRWCKKQEHLKNSFFHIFSSRTLLWTPNFTSSYMLFEGNFEMYFEDKQAYKAGMVEVGLALTDRFLRLKSDYLKVAYCTFNTTVIIFTLNTYKHQLSHHQQAKLDGGGWCQRCIQQSPEKWLSVWGSLITANLALTKTGTLSLSVCPLPLICPTSL